MEQPERATLCFSLLALAEDQDTLIIEAMEEFRNGHDFSPLDFLNNTQVSYSMTYS